jgi:hypothetical protein
MATIVGDYTYYKDKVLGSGNFATVYFGKSNKDPKLAQVAVKIIDYDKVEKKNR